jgi:hypothetical protein
MQGNLSRRLQKAPKLNVTYHLKKKHLEGSRTHLPEVDPEWGPHQIDRSSGGAGRPPPGAKWARLLECSSTACEDQSKPHV